MSQTIFDPKNAQQVLERAMVIPVKDLPLYLESYGSVLPGLSEDRVQILTSDETNKLPAAEGLQCRLAFVNRCMEVMKAEISQGDRRTA